MGWRDRQPDDFGSTESTAREQGWFNGYISYVLALSLILNLVLLVMLAGFSDFNTVANSQVAALKEARNKLQEELSLVRKNLRQTSQEREETKHEAVALTDELARLKARLAQIANEEPAD